MRMYDESGELVDLFTTSTADLNALLRTAVDALRTQITENPGCPSDLRSAVDDLNEAAVTFTNALYREAS